MLRLGQASGKLIPINQPGGIGAMQLLGTRWSTLLGQTPASSQYEAGFGVGITRGSGPRRWLSFNVIELKVVPGLARRRDRRSGTCLVQAPVNLIEHSLWGTASGRSQGCFQI